jgi:hypothetical protein
MHNIRELETCFQISIEDNEQEFRPITPRTSTTVINVLKELYCAIPLRYANYYFSDATY